MSEERPIWTIGHSNHRLGRFLALLEGAGVEVLADVRSQPFSRFNPQFNRRRLSEALRAAGFHYEFLGQELGGRPPERSLYDDEGHALYGAMVATARFREGLRRLVADASTCRVAVMCSEEDPTSCHRRLLIARVLETGGTPVAHIRGDGTIHPETDFANGPVRFSQGALFEDDGAAWKSRRPVGWGGIARP